MDLICPGCKTEYDTEIKAPRILPNCGHTFCSQCIQKWIDKDDEEIYCSEDGIKCEYYQKEKGIDSFPQNNALQNYINKNNLSNRSSFKKSEQAKEEIQQQIQIEKQQQIKETQMEQKQQIPPKIKKKEKCFEHGKTCDLICLTDQKSICSDCVLFGKHKKHRYLSGLDFKKLVRQKLSELEMKRDQYLQNEFNFFVSETQLLNYLEEEIDKAKQNTLHDLRNLLDRVQKTLKQSRLDSSRQIDNFFIKFDKIVSLLCINSESLRNRQLQINQDIAEAKNQIERTTPNFEFLLKQIHSEYNVITRQKQLQDDLKKQKRNMQKLVDKPLQDVTLSFDMNQILQQFQNLIAITQKSPPQEPKQEKIDQRQNQKENEELQQTRDITINEIQEDQNQKSLEEQSNKTNKKSSKELSIIDQDLDDTFSSSSSEPEVVMNTKIEKPKSIVNKNNNFLKRGEQKKMNVTQNFINNSSIQHQNTLPNNSFNYQSFQGGNLNLYQTQDMSYLTNQTVQQNYNMHQTQQFRQSPTSELYQSQNNHRFGTLTNQRQYPSMNNTPQNTYKSVRGINTNFQHSSTYGQPHDFNFYANQQQMNIQRIQQSKKNSISQKKNQKNLSFKNSKLNDTQIEKIILQIKDSREIKSLTLNDNALTHVGFNQLMKAIHTHPTLEKISIRKNLLDEKVFDIIKKYQKKMTAIHYFNFKENRIINNRKNQVILQKFSQTGITILI